MKLPLSFGLSSNVFQNRSSKFDISRNAPKMLCNLIGLAIHVAACRLANQFAELGIWCPHPWSAR
jgi:hypothetical protein